MARMPIFPVVMERNHDVSGVVSFLPIYTKFEVIFPTNTQGGIRARRQ
jgi:hypothetical protein